MALGHAHLVDPRLLALVEPSRAFYARRAAGRGPAGWEELRAARAAAPAPAASRPPAVEEVARADGRHVPVRIHEPRHGRAAGVVLEIHGGGFYLGSAAGSDLHNRRLADALGVAVVSVDYRLSPEHPWPAAPDDCETAALWVVENAADRFGSTALGVIGFSAGATLAMTTLVRLRDRGVPAVDAAVLQFGTYDLSAQTAAGRLIADEYFIRAYAGAAADRTDPDLSPIHADPTGLPPVFMVLGDADVLLDDNLAMSERLAAGGVDVDLRVYPEAPHGFTRHRTPMAEAAVADIDAWLTTRLCGSPATSASAAG